jgi:hypothetical protein
MDLPLLLPLCARAYFDSAAAAALANQAGRVTAWPALVAQADAHGLGPLLYTRLTSAGVTLPPPVKLELQGLAVRHRHANRVRMQVLAEILAATQSAGIEMLVLKGAALAHLVYPEPGLRPMSDLDLLVHPANAHRAQQILAGLGFNAPLPPAGFLPSKHLPAASCRREGLLVSVEVHHNLFSARSPVSFTLAEMTAPPRSFNLNGLTAYTLPDPEMLWHLTEHLRIVAQPFRLIWLADIVGLAERFAAEIDWERVRQNYPLVLSALSLFHFVTPLSASLCRAARLNPGPPPPGVGQGFDGWPHTSIASQRAAGKSYGRILADTFWPPEWWLRLYYGLGADGAIFWQRGVRHPLYITALALNLLLKKSSRQNSQATLVVW